MDGGVSLVRQNSTKGPAWRFLNRGSSKDSLELSTHSNRSVSQVKESLESTSLHLPPKPHRRISLDPSSLHSDSRHRNDRFESSFGDSQSSFGSDAPSRRLRSSSSDLLSPATSLSPQSYFDAMIKSRGYCTKRYPALNTAYQNKPTPLQQASYDNHLVDLVRGNELDEFVKLFECGLSPTPVNECGESLVHSICRRGSYDFFRVLLDAGCDVRMLDRHGRTPLHDACWAAKPNFHIVEKILEVDSRMMLLTDCRGATPLSYVSKKDWPQWLQFLESVKDDFWPTRDVKLLGEEDPPHLMALSPDSRPVADPPHVLSLEMAAKLASGQITPEEVHRLRGVSN